MVRTNGVDPTADARVLLAFRLLFNPYGATAFYGGVTVGAQYRKKQGVDASLIQIGAGDDGDLTLELRGDHNRARGNLSDLRDELFKVSVF